MKRLLSILALSFLALMLLAPGSNTQAAATSRALAPAAVINLTGGAVGAVARMAVKNQSGTADTPADYVTFTTPGTIYKGYRRYILPAGIAPATITAIQVSVNYKGLAKASQAWTWSLYDFSAAKWVVVGSNATATANTWTLLTFATTSPKRFVSSGREIRLLLQSNKNTGNAKLDYESIKVTYAAPPTPVASTVVYNDALRNGWGDWSWDPITVNLANTSPVHAGTKSIVVSYTGGWSGLQFGRNTALTLGSYDTLRFWIHGGTAGGQIVQVQVGDGSTTLTKAVRPTAGAWKMVDMPLTGLTEVTLLAWFNNSAGAQPKFYVDDVSLIASGAPTPTPVPPTAGPDLTVDAGTARHSIDRNIYGMNFADENLAADLTLPVRRWGGNSTSRYNWQTNVQNTGSDWYFENIPVGTGNTADDFVAQNVRTGTNTLMTIPLIGWTPKNPSPADHPYACGFRVSKYGAQQSTDPWDTNCGNGVKPNGSTNVTGNTPSDTSTAIDPSFVTGWINHLVATYGTAASGGVAFYNLDNEPMLWNSTHRDVHPNPTTFDEMKTRTEAYAAAVKAADPGAKTLGPAEWGWCGYFFSALDGCTPDGPDRAAHGGMDFVPWYLQQLQAYETAHGTRILDYLDLHFYPQGDGIFADGQGNAAVQALRLRSTRGLWDSSYVDESWIGQPIYMIPRMHDWVNTYYPGTKLALSEYSFGAMGYMNGALAQADALGIFGREGLDMATLWGPPTTSQPGAYAFRMYLNYDGSHSAFGDTGVSASSADQSRVAVYAAQRSSDQALTLMIVNKTGRGQITNLSLAGFTPSGDAQVYQYSAANLNAIQHLPDQPVTASGFSATYPANSITLVVIPGTAP